MVLSHQTKQNDIVMDIVIDYNTRTERPEEVISIIAIDLYDGSEVELTHLLHDKFNGIIKFMVDSVDWDKVYQNSINEILK
jgi:hypothetical protein